MPPIDSFATRDRPHVHFSSLKRSHRFQPPNRPRAARVLREDYAAHAASLLEQLAHALHAGPVGDPGRLPVEGLRPGKVVEVTTLQPAPNARGAAKIPSGLEFRPQEIVLLRADRHADRTETGLFFIPDHAQGYLRDRIAAYGQDPGNRERPDIDRFQVVEHVRPSSLAGLFGGSVDLASADRGWWEIWVPGPGLRARHLAQHAREAGFTVHEDRLVFPETTVLFVHGAAAGLARFAARVPGAIAEIRRAADTIEHFFSARPSGITPRD